MLGKREESDFLEKLRTDVQEYKNLHNADIATISNFDCKKLRGDWEAVGNYIRLSINEEIEQDER